MEKRITIPDPMYNHRYQVSSSHVLTTTTTSTINQLTQKQILKEKKLFTKRFKVELGSVKVEEIDRKQLLHCEDAPAVIENIEEIRKEVWYNYGKKHREDGAAETWTDKEGKVILELFYLDGRQVLDKERIRQLTDKGK